MIMVVYLLLLFTSKRGYSLLRNKNKTWSHVNTGARPVLIFDALSLRLPSFTSAVFWTTFGCEDRLKNFGDTDFKSFILQLFHIQPVCKHLSVCFGESCSLLFFRPFDSAWEREREAEAREQKEVKRSLFSVFLTRTHGFRFRPDARLNVRLFDMWRPVIITRNNFFNRKTFSFLLFYRLTTSGPGKEGNCI